MRKFLNWLFSHGVPIAYAFLITVSLAISGVVLLATVLVAHWWSKVK